jgi:hypothetical protein
MCTVTYIPSGNKFFFTSSRDEQAVRLTAAFPELHEISGQRLLYPKDMQAGGSWIAVHESGNTGVLINGAIQAHQSKPPYRKSRGLILLDLISSTSPVDVFNELEFNRIEPFTVILFEDKKLYSGKWDGNRKWLDSLDSYKPHIWSSVTLYEPAIIRKRENWFNKWLSENPTPSTTDIINFHKQGGDGDPVNDLLMNRDGRLFTNSISLIRLSPEVAAFRYVDLRNGKTADRFLPFQKKFIVKA